MFIPQIQIYQVALLCAPYLPRMLSWELNF